MDPKKKKIPTFEGGKKNLKFKVGLSNPFAQTNRANLKVTRSEACDS